MWSISRVSRSISSIWLASRRAAAGLASRRPRGQLDLAAKRGQRRAQLVRQRGAELAHLADRVFEPAERLVEGVRHPIQFVAHAANRQPPLERRHVDLARRRRHP